MLHRSESVEIPFCLCIARDWQTCGLFGSAACPIFNATVALGSLQTVTAASPCLLCIASKPSRETLCAVAERRERKIMKYLPAAAIVFFVCKVFEVCLFLCSDEGCVCPTW